MNVRPAVLADLEALTEIYNYYVIHTTITFDLEPFTPAERRPWFEEHMAIGKHRLRVAEENEGAILGYATTSRWRSKPAYDTTVESSVYCRHDSLGRGVGTALYSALFESIADEGVHRITAGASLPNAASIALHRRFGFREVGVFSAVGLKFGKFWDVAWFERPGT